VSPLRALPYFRTRSDAEGRALERYADAGRAVPEVIAGREADLVDREKGLIVEIDGPQFHLFPDEDEARERGWEDDGYRTVRRPSDAVYR
jgi:very-short-patch-repair endonuclease